MRRRLTLVCTPGFATADSQQATGKRLLLATGLNNLKGRVLNHRTHLSDLDTFREGGDGGTLLRLARGSGACVLVDALAKRVHSVPLALPLRDDLKRTDTAIR